MRRAVVARVADPVRTVRAATLEVLERFAMTTLFANPGSTEVALLSDLPDNFSFVLALHEGSVVGAATGWAIGNGRPAAVILHTTAGLGNAVGALATARVNRAPLVVFVGQQDRRHLHAEPFLAGRLHGLAGEYPVWVGEPARPQDVPSVVARAVHEASYRRGPALVVVPMDDWDAPADDGMAWSAPETLRVSAAADREVLQELADLLDRAVNPALVVGGGADDVGTWTGLQQLAEKLSCPVWQESFGARAGFPQDHPRFAGHLPAGRQRLRATLAPFDVVVAVGALTFRQYPYEPGPFVDPGTVVAALSEDVEDLLPGAASLAVVGPLAASCAALSELVADRAGHVGPDGTAGRRVAERPGEGEDLRAAHVLGALAERLPADAILVEETPSSRPDLHALVPARQPLGFVSAAMGGLGFAMPAAVGLRMAKPQRPVVAVVGDGSSVYAIQSLWTAVHYRVGILVVVLSNGRYAIMDRLAEKRGGKAPWPAFEELDIATLAAGFGCDHRTVTGYDEMVAALDATLPTLAERTEPLLLDVHVITEPEFNP